MLSLFYLEDELGGKGSAALTVGPVSLITCESDNSNTLMSGYRVFDGGPLDSGVIWLMKNESGDTRNADQKQIC